MTRMPHWVGRVTLTTLAYFLFGRAALGFAVPPGYASVVWPAAGLSLAVILLGGRRLWPGVWLGSFLVNVSIAADRTGSCSAADLTVASLIATGATAQAFLGAFLLRRLVNIPLLLVKPREIWLTLALTGPVHCLVNASWSVFWMCMMGVSPWNTFLDNWFAWWIGDSLGAVVAMLLLMSFWGTPRLLWRPRLVSVAFPTLAVLAMTIAVFCVGRDWEHADIERRLQANAQTAARGTEGWFANANVGLVAWRNFLTDDPTAEIKQRDRFVLDTLDYHQSLQALGILKVVSGRERAAFEAEQRSRIPRFRIVEMRDNGDIAPAANRDQHVCLAYLFTPVGQQGTLGLDFAADANFRDALLRATVNDSPVAVAFRPALPAQCPENSVWVLLPLYDQPRPETASDRRTAIRGFAVALYDMDWVVSRGTADLRSQDLSVTWQPTPQESLPQTNSIAISTRSGKPRNEVLVVLGGLTGTLQLEPGQAYLTSSHSKSLWIVQLLGFALAILIAVIQLISSGQAFLVDEEVQKRTLELTHEVQERKRVQDALTRSEADARKLAIIANRTDNLVILTDALGQIEWVNEAFTRVTQYTLEEIKGQTPGSVLQGPETDQRTVTHMRECLRRGEGFRVEVLNYGKLGRKHWLFIEVQPLRDENGQLIRFMAIESDITDRKMAEHALRDSERKLAAVISTAMDGFWESDREGRILSVNDAYCRASGYSREELLCLRISDLEALETPEETQRHIKKIFAEGSDRFETRHRRKDGSDYDVEISVRFVPQWDHSFVFIQDISARKHAEARERTLLAEAAAANAKFRTFFDQGALFASIMDLDGSIIEPNRLSWEACGYTRAQIIGKPFWEGPWWTPSASLIERIREGSQLAANGQTFRSELPYFVADGNQRMVDLIIQPIRDDSGRVVFLAPTGSDITDRKRAEAALRASEERFRQLAENIEDVFWIMDIKAQSITYVSPAYERIWGIPVAELYSNPMSWLNAIHPEDRPRITRINENKAEVGYVDLEYRIVRPDGRMRWIWDRGIVVPDESGKPQRMVGLAQDMTLWKESQDQLQLAKESAETANRAKSAFLANVSHEIRTPMNGILGMAELLLREETTARQRDRLEVIQNSAGALLSVINDLLDLSRIEAGKLTLELRPFELHKELTQIIDLVGDAANRRGLQIKFSIAPGVARYVLGDAGRLRQVLFNLIGNAIKFTERGSVSIRVDKPLDGEPNLIAFAVTDTGIGIPRDKLASIFQPFVQADNSVTRRFGGTGLGLSISARLVEAMGGTIDIESMPDQGSTFCFTARLTPCAAPVIESPTTSSRNWSENLRPLCVLLAEDNAVNQLVAKEMLQHAGHRVRVVNNGLEVLAALEEERFDVVLMDVQMPDMDGLEATVAIRSREATTGGHLPIIALTAMAVRDDEDRCRRAGMDRFITKPINWVELGQTLRDHCGNENRPVISVDRVEILRRTGGKLSLVQQILDIFATTYPQQLAAMRTAIEEKQPLQLSRAAHKLVGGLGNFDRAEGMKLAESLEALGRTGDLFRANVVLGKLDDYLGRLVSALRVWLTDEWRNATSE